VDPDQHHFGNLDPDPHPHQTKFRIRIRIKVISWIPNRIRINLQMTCQNVWIMSLFEHFFKGLSLYLVATYDLDPDPDPIKSGSTSNKNQNQNPHPDPHQGDK
jgi:hypothetical protein